MNKAEAKGIAIIYLDEVIDEADHVSLDLGNGQFVVVP